MREANELLGQGYVLLDIEDKHRACADLDKPWITRFKEYTLGKPKKGS